MESTIVSVIEQTYKNIEFIVVDGGSTDGTVEIVKKYESHIDYWRSGPDGGIYSAMNIGIDLATGLWLCFMNSGDRFFSRSAVESAMQSARESTADILYGDSEMRYAPNLTVMNGSFPIDGIWKGMPCSHQAMFVKTRLQREHRFDTRYGIAADYDFLYKAHKLGYHCKKTGIRIASVDVTGISAAKTGHSVREQWRIARKYSDRPQLWLYYGLLWTYSLIKDYLRTLLPERIKHMLFRSAHEA